MRGLILGMEAAWLRFWFGFFDRRPLEIVRIGIGFTLLLSYASQLGHVAEFYSDEGWLPMDLAVDLVDPTSHSLLFSYSDPDSVRLLWSVLVAASAALTLGWRTSIVKWVVWVLHLSFGMRAPYILYGVDDICSNLLLVMCLAPIGARFSLDAAAGRAPGGWGEFDRARSSAALRLIQIQMAVCFFFAGAEKLQGPDWWGGDAIWYAMTDYEFTFIPLAPLAHNEWLVNAMTYSALLIEISYPFLVWGQGSRGLALATAIGVHIGVAIMMGLVLFGLAMIAGHLAFVRPAWIDAATAWIRSRSGGNDPPIADSAEPEASTSSPD